MKIGNLNKPMMTTVLMLVMGIFFSDSLIASDRAASFNDVTQMMKDWQHDQHLYVRGSLSVPEKSLDSLEKWLDENGENWTVILMQNANSQEWKDTRGVSYYGMDAVENAVGRGLANNEKFAAMVDESDGKRNGAIFVLFLEERKFSYFGEEAYDERYLGENAWRGNLDRSARRAMQSGSGVVNAVKDTIKAIDGKLKESKKREAQLRERAKIEKKETQAWVEREAAAMLTSLKTHAQAAGVIKANTAAEDGEIANPPLNDWQQMINEAKGNPNPFLAKQALVETTREMNNHRQAMLNWHRFPEEMAKLEGQLSEFVVDKNFREAESIVSELKKKIQQAKKAHARGAQEHHAILRNVQNEIRSLIEENQRVSAERIRQEEYEEAKREAEKAAAFRQQQINKNIGLAGGALTGMGLLGLGVFSNRRRKKQKLLAEQLYAEWKESMSKRFDKLFEVMDRATIVVGSEQDLPERGYQGETLTHSLGAIRNVDKAFILTASVDSVLKEAKELIYPSSVSSMSVNIFSRSRYDDALDLLERKPLGSHLPIDEIKVLDRGEEQMLGGRGNTENMELSFTELIAEFDHTILAAVAELDIVEDAWETISARTEQLGNALSTIAAKDLVIENLAIDDGLFRLDSLFEEWLPKAESYHLEGIEVGKHDPVLALKKEVDRGDRMAHEMDKLIGDVLEFRDSKLADIEEGSKILHELHRGNDWVTERLVEFDDELNGLSQRGVRESVEELLSSQKEGMFAFNEEVAQACRLAKISLATIPKLIKSVSAKAATARSEIAQALDLTDDKILKERDAWDPDFLLAEAERLRISTQLCLDDGKTQQAQYLADQSQKNIEEANEVITDAMLANSSFEKDYAHVSELLKEADDLRNLGVNIMSDLVADYSRAALQIDPENKAAGNFIEVEEALQGAYSQLKKDIITAKDYQQKGWVLHASQYLYNAREAHEHLRGMHEFIAARQRELADLEQKNLQTLGTHERDLLNLEEAQSDPRVTCATQNFFSQIQVVFEQAKAAVNPKYGESNPYVAEDLLDEIKQRILALETRIQGDREVFMVAESALSQLSKLHAQSLVLVSKSETDGIRDSEETEDSITDIQKAGTLIEAHQETIAEPHNNWSNLYDEIHATHEFLAAAISVLKQELENARAALANIRSASGNVSAAMHWTGSYGVSITGSYGSDELTSAQQALDRGEYHRATSYAAAAQREARSAISSAESRVASIRHQREEAARARRRARSRASSASSGFGISSSPSRSSSFSSHSSMSSSSRSSTSGSGFTRSGW